MDRISLKVLEFGLSVSKWILKSPVIRVVLERELVKFFKEFGHCGAGGPVETNKVEFCLDEVHRSNDMFKSFELGRGDKIGLKLIVH